MYETVEDYKKTKFGLIPNDWIIKKGEGLSTKITKGASPKWQGFDYQDNGILFVTSENVREGVLDVTQPKFLPIEFGEKQKNSKLKKGDILINIVGASIGRSCEYDIDVEANINQAVCLFRAKSEADKSFIKYYLQSNSVKKRLLGTQTESARPNLSLTDIREFEFVLPTNDKEKLKIASILSTWDKAIELKEKLIEQKKEQKKGLMQKLLTGEVRLLGFEGEWEKVKLGDICNITTGKLDANAMKENGKYKFFTCAKEVYSIDEYAFNTEALLVSGNGANVGYIHYYKGKFNAYQRTYVLDQFSNNILFIKYLLDKNLKHRIHKEKNAGNTPYITLGTLSDMFLPLPSEAEQYEIAKILEKLDNEIDLLEKDLEYVKHQKQGLMQLLLTGKVRVKV